MRWSCSVMVIAFITASSEWLQRDSWSCAPRQHACLLQTISSRSIAQQKGDPIKITEDLDVTLPSMRRPISEGTFPSKKISLLAAGKAPLKSNTTGLSAATGSNAALNEGGYRKVSRLKSNAEMGIFIRRFVSGLGLSVVDDAGFNGVVPYYSGVRAAQSFEKLEREILSAPSWLKPNKDVVSLYAKEPRDDFSDKKQGMLSHLQKGSLRKKDADHTFHASPYSDDLSSTNMATGATASLDDDGYKAVSKLKSNSEMGVFIGRLVTDLGGRIVEEAGFNGVVPYYSGQHATQTFEALKKELLTAASAKNAWIEIDSHSSHSPNRPFVATIQGTAEDTSSIGSATSLDEHGYKAVSKLKSNSEMGAFIQKLIGEMGGRIIDEPGFNGVVPYYSGQRATQSLEALKREIQSSAKSKHPWVELSASNGKIGAALSSGLVAIDAQDEGEMDMSDTTGSTASLDEVGYEAVSGLESNTEMKAFMQRVVADMGGHIVSEAGFNGVIPYYSGAHATQSYEAMKQEILSASSSKNAWVEVSSSIRKIGKSETIANEATLSNGFEDQESTNSGDSSGSSAPLDEEGYRAVSSLKSDSDMKTFIERLIKSMDGEIADEAGLNGIVPYYSGTHSTQSFSALSKEVLSAHWVD